jgi:hypothetical protein
VPPTESGSGSGGVSPPRSECAFDDFTVNISATMSLPTAPGQTQWGPTPVAGSTLLGAPANCARKSRVDVTMKGKPDSATFYQKIKSNEYEHVADFKAASEQFLVPYYRSILALRGTGANDQACRADLQAKFAAIPDTAINNFLTRILADVRRRDTPGQHPTRAAINILDNCNRVEITAEPKPAAPTP